VAVKKPANGHANRQQQLVNHFRNSNCGSIKPAGNYYFHPFHRYPQEIKYPELYYQTEGIQVLRETDRTSQFCFVFGRSKIKISAQGPAVLTEDCGVFP
jgi:hypothetical protein